MTHRARLAQLLGYWQRRVVGLQLREQQSQFEPQALPTGEHGVSHQPAEFRASPEQQSALEAAAPWYGTQLERHRWSWFTAGEPQ